MSTPTPAAIAAATNEIVDRDFGPSVIGIHVQAAIDTEKAPLVAALEELMESQIEYESCAGAFEQNPDVQKIRDNHRAALIRSRKAWNAARTALAAARATASKGGEKE